MAKKKQVVEQVAGDVFKNNWAANPMRKPFIEKVVLSIGVGESGEKLQKAKKVLEDLTGQTAVLRQSKKSVKEWAIRKGENIAVSVTLRGDKATEILHSVLIPYDNRILRQAFDDRGNFSFGLDEHIKIPNVKYDPQIGIFGFNTSVRLIRPGMRVKVRRKNRTKVAKEHYVSRQEAIYYMQTIFGAEIVERMEERYY